MNTAEREAFMRLILRMGQGWQPPAVVSPPCRCAPCAAETDAHGAGGLGAIINCPGCYRIYALIDVGGLRWVELDEDLQPPPARAASQAGRLVLQHGGTPEAAMRAALMAMDSLNGFRRAPEARQTVKRRLGFDMDGEDA